MFHEDGYTDHFQFSFMYERTFLIKDMGKRKGLYLTLMSSRRKYNITRKAFLERAILKVLY